MAFKEERSIEQCIVLTLLRRFQKRSQIWALSSCTGSQEPMQRSKQCTAANQWLLNKEITMVIPLWTDTLGQNPNLPWKLGFWFVKNGTADVIMHRTKAKRWTKKSFSSWKRGKTIGSNCSFYTAHEPKIDYVSILLVWKVDLNALWGLISLHSIARVLFHHMDIFIWHSLKRHGNFQGISSLEVVAKREFWKRLLCIVVFSQNLSFGDSHENTSDLF